MRAGRKNPDPAWKGLMASLREEVKALREEGKHEEAQQRQAKYLGEGELPPVPTFEEQLAKAGGRSIAVPVGVADWHELDI